jgi:LmbE family N-acetylglucosaminyl deacetylase
MAGRLCVPTLPMRARGRVLARAAVLAAVLVSACVLPAQAQADPSGIGSDEFNTFVLDPSRWTFVNPLGDATLTMTGSHAQISLPAGTRHDLWGTVDEVPALMQAAPNTDFEVEVKWDSAVSSPYHLQGLVVAQDANRKLRIETHNDGDGTKLFVAAIADGSGSVLHYGSAAGGAPVYFRLSRTGNAWTLRTSANGITWTVAASFTYTLSVSSIGPFAGNSGGSPPAFTSRIDYFRRFLPDATPPSITSIAASPSGIGAVVSWQTDEPASGSVAYGTDTSYAGGTVTNLALTSAHSIALESLACGTLHHFQVRSRDAAGNEAVSADRTFTTAPCPSAITSDEFNGPLNSGVWTYVNPVGDATLTMTGSHAEFSLPAGVRHDLWTNAIEVPRLLQAAPNNDFEVEVKWDSAVSAAYQLQGLVVVQDSDDLLRIETHYDGSGTRLFVARISGGSASVVHNGAFAGGAPLYFRLKRTGNAWVLRSSTNGDTWTTAASFTQALAVTAIGPFAGNSGSSPPAFTSRVDYFRDIPPDLTPPAITGIGSSNTGVAATVTWATDELATSEVRYGPTAAYGAGSVTREGLRRTHSVVLHGLACATTYHFQIRSVDSSNNVALSSDRTFTTAACPSAIASDEFNAATLNTSLWTFIDPVGDVTLGLSGTHAEFSVPAGVRHDLWTNVDEVPRLLQAAPNSDFEVEEKWDSAVSAQYQIQGFLVEEDANDLLRLEVHYETPNARLFVARVRNGVASVIAERTISGGAPIYLKVKRVGSTWRFSHSADGASWALGANFTNDLVVNAIGPFAGNSGSNPPAFVGRLDYFREVTDRTPPVITELVVTPGSTSAVVSWTTDEPATSQVAHGVSTSYGGLTSDPKLTTRHWLRVTNLACNTAYHLQARSADDLGNQRSSADQAFTTKSCAGASGPEIDVWTGDTPTFGSVGIPQRWVNITGNVYDSNGVSSLRATLNGAHPQNLNMGPNGDRLERAGDFNLELNRDLLLPGRNEIVITATDTVGNLTSRTVEVDWRGFSAGQAPSPTGPVLVIVAHGDDAFLGMAGMMYRHKLAGRRVYLAVATNGDQPQEGTLSGYCGAADGNPATTAHHGLTLAAETMEASGLLGMSYSTNLAQTDIFFLGYPNFGLAPISEAVSAPWQGGGTGLQRTYAEDLDGSIATCNGDLRYLISGQHSGFTAAALAADFDAVIDRTDPSDVYTLAEFDGHADHAEVSRQTIASVRRLGISANVHRTLIHPHGSEHCMGFSAANWPNPMRLDDDPLSRFTPTALFTAPPVPTCEAPTATSWGPQGAPNESVEVPAAMQATSPQNNLKYRTVNVWDSQCPPDDPAHVTCGYFNAFVKKNEFFWLRTYSGQRSWPTVYTANWSSTASIPQVAQVLEGAWVYEAGADGVRPLAPGFDRAIVLGQFDWSGYDVTVPVTVRWFDQTKSSAGVGVGLGWQGHADYGGSQPRAGHPYGSICSFGRSTPEPTLPRLEMVENRGSVEDTVVAAEAQPRTVTLGVPYTMKFRRANLGNGSARYSCKLWRSNSPEPSAWDLTVDLTNRPGTTGPFPGSSFLLAHNIDATFGDVQVVPVAGP